MLKMPNGSQRVDKGKNRNIRFRFHLLEMRKVSLASLIKSVQRKAIPKITEQFRFYKMGTAEHIQST